MVIAGTASCEITRGACGVWVSELTGRPTYTHIDFFQSSVVF